MLLSSYPIVRYQIRCIFVSDALRKVCLSESNFIKEISPPGKKSKKKITLEPNYLKFVSRQGIVHITHANVALVKKNTTPHTQQPTSSVFVALATHQSPPSYPDLANHRNLVLQEHTPRSSLLRLIMFVLPKCRRIAILSTAQSLQVLSVADFIREIVFDFQMMEIRCGSGTNRQPLLSS